jgi:hypothetical protein
MVEKMTERSHKRSESEVIMEKDIEIVSDATLFSRAGIKVEKAG